MSLSDEIFILALAVILILGIISFGLLTLIQLFIPRQKHDCSRRGVTDEIAVNETNQTQDNANQQVTQLAQTIERYHQEDIQWHTRHDLKNDAYAIYGLALASTGLAVAAFAIASTNTGTRQHNWQLAAIVSSIVAIVFWVLGLMRYVRSRRV